MGRLMIPPRQDETVADIPLVIQHVCKHDPAAIPASVAGILPCRVKKFRTIMGRVNAPGIPVSAHRECCQGGSD